MKNKIRADFPILKNSVNEHPLIYFDNAATTQKPQSMIDAMVDFYAHHNAPVHRSVYTLGEQATTAYEGVRTKVARFIGARDASEIVFTSGTTEGINFIASTWAHEHLCQGDEILLTQMEHHANLVPWQRLAQERGVRLVFIPVLPDGSLDMNMLPALITPAIKFVAVTHVSNALGTHNDIATIIAAAHAVGAKVLIDAAQSVPHQKINVTELNCDFLVFSGHKMLGPTGVGVLYIKKELHDHVAPYQRGGSMVFEVGEQTAIWQKAPYKFEAGTPPIAQVIGLGAAIDYLVAHDFDQMRAHEAALCAQLIEGLADLRAVTILGPIEQLKKSGHLVSFTVAGWHAHDVAAYLDAYGICVRAGHHCAQPLAKKMGLESTVRVSFYLYNTHEEVAFFLSVLKKLLIEPRGF